MAKFDNVKVGDKVFSTVYGWGKVFSVDKTDVHFPLVIEFDKNIRMCYRSDGTTNVLNKFPNLFWNEIKLPTEEEDKKPFNLVEFLRENLEPKDFKYGKYNYYISYENDIKEFEYKYDYYNEDIGTVYLKEIDNGKMIASLLDFNKVTPQQLKQAYKELGWL